MTFVREEIVSQLFDTPTPAASIAGDATARQGPQLPNGIAIRMAQAGGVHAAQRHEYHVRVYDLGPFACGLTGSAVSTSPTCASSHSTSSMPKLVGVRAEAPKATGPTHCPRRSSSL